jgi:uncharacterized protein YbjQ (UPF0145 family)
MGYFMTDEIIVISTPYLPGYRITITLGFTCGLTIRSRGLGRNITSGLVFKRNLQFAIKASGRILWKKN